MMQKKKKLFTLVHCAICCGEPTFSTHIHRQAHAHHSRMCSLFLSNKTLTMKHGQLSFSDSSVVHNTAHSQSR